MKVYKDRIDRIAEQLNQIAEEHAIRKAEQALRVIAVIAVIFLGLLVSFVYQTL